MAKLRVFIADDHTLVRDGLVLLIGSQPDMEVIGTADNGRDLLEQLRSCTPDIVLMDVSMPNVNGIQATRQLVSSDADILIVALTRHAEPGYVRQLFQAGARGYVLKQAPALQMLDALRAVAAGGTYLDPSLSVQLTRVVGRSQRTNVEMSHPELSAREADVVRLLARGYSNKEIAVQLDLSVKTIDTYKARALEKLGLHSRADLVRYALFRGWLDIG